MTDIAHVYMTHEMYTKMCLKVNTIGVINHNNNIRQFKEVKAVKTVKVV